MAKLELNKQSMERLHDWEITSFRPVFELFGETFRSGMRALFANKAGRVNSKMVDGPAWEPLSDKYKRWKERIVPFGTLVFDGSMADTFGNRNDNKNVTVINDFDAAFGSRHYLAKYHQDGTNKMPVRQIIFQSERRNRAFKVHMIDFLVAKLRQKNIEIQINYEDF